MMSEPSQRELLLFTYGTLQPGERNAHVLRHAPLWSVPATAIGWELWHLDPNDHPAILPLDEASPLHGTLFCFSAQLHDEVLRDCDTLEDFYPSSPDTSRYLRQLTEVMTIEDVPRTLQAHIYLWHPRNADSLRAQHQLVSHGHWIDFARALKRTTHAP